MGKFCLRFYGRFLCAETVDEKGKSAGELTILAINPGYNPDVRSEPHTFLMAALGNTVAPWRARPADVRMVAALPNDARGDHSVWNVANHDIFVPIDLKNFQWAPESGTLLNNVNLIALARQSTNRDHRFAQRHITTHDPNGPVVGAIHLSTGLGQVSSLPKNFRGTDPVVSEPQAATYEFVQFQGTGPSTTIPPSTSLPDLIQVDLALPANEALLLQVKRRGGGPASTVAIRSDNNEPTVVTFSNLCTAYHREYDEEFAAFYEVLENPPSVHQRLIPRETVHHFGPGDDCYASAYLPYQPERNQSR